MELMGKEQSTFADMVSELGLSASMKSGAEYTFLAPLNLAFSGKTRTLLLSISCPSLYFQQRVKFESWLTHTLLIVTFDKGECFYTPTHPWIDVNMYEALRK